MTKNINYFFFFVFLLCANQPHSYQAKAKSTNSSVFQRLESEFQHENRKKKFILLTGVLIMVATVKYDFYRYH